MTRQISTDALKAMMAQETGELFLVLATLDHPDFSQTWRFVNDTQDLTRGADTFLSYPFAVEFHNDDDNVPIAQLALDNIGQEIMAEIRSIKGRIDASFECVRHADPTDVVFTSDYEIADVNADQVLIRGTLIFFEPLDEPLPYQTFNQADFPGLYL